MKKGLYGKISISGGPKSDLVGALIYDTLRESGVRIATPFGTLVDLSNEDHDFFAALKREVSKWEKRKILSYSPRSIGEMAQRHSRVG